MASDSQVRVQKSALNIVMGAATFGSAEADIGKINYLDDVKAILDVFQAHGHQEVDTARQYANGTSEEYLGNIRWRERGLEVSTKLYPDSGNSIIGGKVPISHSPADVRRHLMISLKALKTNKVDIWYLHGPDRHSGVSYLEVMRGVNELYEEGYFKRFGVSNFMSWEVAELCSIARQHGWIQPTVYQGLYNATHRNVEPELFPCLRKFGLRFYAFNPLGGGFFAGKIKKSDDTVESKSRFDPQTRIGQGYRKRYWNDHYFQAIEVIDAAAKKHGLSMVEVALRWLVHHSLLKREFGDSIIIGASKLSHVEQNLIDLEKGPLPEDVVAALDEAWMIVKPVATNYFH